MTWYFDKFLRKEKKLSSSYLKEKSTHFPSAPEKEICPEQLPGNCAETWHFKDELI